MKTSLHMLVVGATLALGNLVPAASFAPDGAPARPGGGCAASRPDNTAQPGWNAIGGNGNATVQFNLGTTKDATFLRAETAP